MGGCSCCCPAHFSQIATVVLLGMRGWLLESLPDTLPLTLSSRRRACPEPLNLSLLSLSKHEGRRAAYRRALSHPFRFNALSQGLDRLKTWPRGNKLAFMKGQGWGVNERRLSIPCPPTSRHCRPADTPSGALAGDVVGRTNKVQTAIRQASIPEIQFPDGTPGSRRLQRLRIQPSW